MNDLNNIEYALRVAQRLKKLKGYSTLPIADELNKSGFSRLDTAISKHHGGMRKFRLLLGENTKKIFRPNGFFSNMAEEDLVNFVESNYHGKGICEVTGLDPTVMRIINERKLLPTLVSKGILIRKKRKPRYFSKLTNNNLRTLAKKKLFGKTVTEAELEDPALINEIRARDQMDLIVNKGILIRRWPTGYIKKMNDSELISYVKSKYNGRVISEVESESSGLLAVLRKRKLLDTLVAQAVLVRRMGKNEYVDMTESALVDYVSENYSGKTFTDLCKEDKTLYREVMKRGLDERLVDEKILIRKIGKQRYYKDWENLRDFLNEFITKNGHFPTQEELNDQKKSVIISAMTKYHGGAGNVKERMGLERGRIDPKKAKDWNWIKHELELIISTNHGKFPTGDYLVEQKRGEILRAIEAHHVSLSHCRKLMGYEQIRKPNGYWNDWNNFSSELKEVIAKLGHFPKISECPSSMQGYFKFYGGIEEIKIKLENSDLVKTREQFRVGSLLEEYANG